MSTRVFLTHDDGFLALQNGTVDWANDDIYAVLVTHAHGTPDRATETEYSDISTDECSDLDYVRQAVGSKTITLNGTNIKFDCAKILFGESVQIEARYLYFLVGTAATPASTDLILGHVDLTGDGDANSGGLEFSFTPASSGLFYYGRSAAA